MKKKPPEHPIRTWRINNRMTLEEAAGKLHCSIPHLCLIELRKSRPSFDLARTIAKVSGLSLEQVSQ